jgi:hypothetical protein
MGHKHAHLDSGKTDYYTPPEIVDAASVAMGGIDLDPASSIIANQVVGASVIYTKELGDGLDFPWFGRVWLNHPFERGRNGLWVDRIVGAYESGEIDEACCITWANMSEVWFKPLLSYAHCLPYGRTHYREADGSTKRGATKGSVITYLGPNLDRFAKAFKEIGSVRVPYSMLTE